MPRDPGRIQPTLDALEAEWRKHPDWRLCQLISNLHGTGPQDIFYTENEDLLAALRIHAEEDRQARLGLIWVGLIGACLAVWACVIWAWVILV